MSATITIDEAQASLKELVHRLAPGEEVVITENEQPVARLVSEPPQPSGKQRPGPGLGKGMVTIVADDDEHLKDFAEYMPCLHRADHVPALSQNGRRADEAAVQQTAHRSGQVQLGRAC